MKRDNICNNELRNIRNVGQKKYKLNSNVKLFIVSTPESNKGLVCYMHSYQRFI